MKHQKYINFFFILLGSFLLIWLTFICGKKIKQRWIVEKTIRSSHWKARVKQIENAPLGKYKTVFLGNSLTEMFDIQYYFNDTTLLNCGIVGDFSEGLLKRSDILIRLKPEKLFIEIGINDIIEKISLSEICNNYERLITKIKSRSPSTAIYIQSNLPVIINRPSILTNDRDVNGLVLQQNKNLQEICSKYGCTFIDIYDEMAKEKDKTSLFIWDGVHLTPKAYLIWKKVVNPYLK